jgi:hypothetical protein
MSSAKPHFWTPWRPAGGHNSHWWVNGTQRQSEAIVIIGIVLGRCPCDHFLPVSSTYPNIGAGETAQDIRRGRGAEPKCGREFYHLVVLAAERGSVTDGCPSKPLVSYQVLPTTSWVDPSCNGVPRRWAPWDLPANCIFSHFLTRLPNPVQGIDSSRSSRSVMKSAILVYGSRFPFAQAATRQSHTMARSTILEIGER